MMSSKSTMREGEAGREHSRRMPPPGTPIGGVRSDLNTMLLPLFSEQPDATAFQTEIDGCTLTMHSDEDGVRLPTSLDRKILNLISAHVRDAIRVGGRPTRHITIHRQELLDLLNGSGTHAGGADYRRLTERLQRLLSVRIVAERAIGGSTSRRRHFRWIDAFEEDLYQTGRGKELVKLKISLSEDAFVWITRFEGFDMSHQDFTAMTSPSASISRIFDICLAKLVASRGSDVFIQIDELRRRIPINNELKGFKARTLKTAMAAIANNDFMSQMLSLELCRQTDDGYMPLAGRAPLEEVYLKITRGPGDLPSVNCLLPEDKDHVEGEDTPGGAFASLTAEEDESLPLFREVAMTGP